MARIFINYRRDDAPGVAGRLFDHLALKYARSELFMDVDAMQPGLDFAKQLDVQVSQCQVLLAVIGPHWFEAHDQAGKRRLDNDKDYVRIELASALKRDIAVIPVLVDGAFMPPEERLSDDLKPLARRHALELRHTRFDADSDAIMHALEQLVPRSRVPWRFVAPGIAIAAAIAVGIVVMPKLRGPPQPPINLSHQQTMPAQSPVTASTPSGLPPGIKLGEMMNGVALRGSLFRVTDIPSDPVNCQGACRAETRCVAWTYTQPGASAQSARCSLKAVIPAQSQDACCTSGVERVPAPELREPPPVPAGLVGAQRGIELEGGTYRYFGGTDATPEACQAACRSEGQCLAWDYAQPGVFGSDARCFLKNKSSTQVASPCCVAGFERQVAASGTSIANPAPAGVTPAPGNGPMVNTNLRGSDYRNFDLSADNVTLCQDACKADNRCLAWTYVHPGQQVAGARCWLKNPVPEPSANSCCTSGIERAEAR